MNKKLYFITTTMICIFIGLMFYNYTLNKNINNRREKLIKVNSTQSSFNSYNSKNKVKYSYVLKEVQSLEKANVEDITLENRTLNMKLSYVGDIGEFIKDEDIKKFFLKNKEFNVKSVIFNGNKVIININCIIDL